MKKFTVGLFFSLSILLLSRVGFSQAWDYMDVAPGYETLNLAIEGDTTSTGEPVTLNRAYRLERDGIYLINASIVNVKGSPLRIVAAEGPGAKPLLVMAVDETGKSNKPAKLEGDAYFKDIYLSGSNMIGNDIRYGILSYGEGARIVFDAVEMDFADQAHVKTYAAGNKIYWLNSEIRNGFLLPDAGRGRFFDARGSIPDSIVMINNTFYVNKNRIFRFAGALGKNIILDHNTFYLNAYGTTFEEGDHVSGPFELEGGINVRITNNIFQDLALEAMRYPSTLSPTDKMPIIPIDSIGTEEYPESSRSWVIKNNVYGWSPEAKAFWASIDTVVAPVFLSPYGMSTFFNGNNPNFVQENNFEEYIEFTDAPSIDKILAYCQHRYNTNFSNVDNPDFRADRNGTGTLQDNPETFGPAEDPYNFDYPATQAAYTAGEGGFPVGDLNWFPDKKAEWEGYVTGIDKKKIGMVSTYQLQQNYPNPFNPTTRIVYSLPRPAKVSLIVFNALGQKVATLVNNKRLDTGTHVATWNSTSSGKKASTGIYYYQLRADGLQLTKKMLLIK